MGHVMDAGWSLKIAACLLAVLLSACSHSDFDPPERSGPIGLVDTGSGFVLYMGSDPFV